MRCEQRSSTTWGSPCSLPSAKLRLASTLARTHCSSSGCELPCHQLWEVSGGHLAGEKTRFAPRAFARIVLGRTHDVSVPGGAMHNFLLKITITACMDLEVPTDFHDEEE